MKEVFLIMGKWSNIGLAIFKFFHADDTLGHSIELVMELSVHQSVD